MAFAETITAKVVALAVVILIIVGTTLPAIIDAQNQQVSNAQNVGYKFMAEIGSDLTLSISYDSEAGTYTIGDYVVNISEAGINASDVGFLNTNLVVRLRSNGSMTVTDYVNGSRAVITAISITSGVFSYNYAGVEYTGSITGNCYYLSDSGKYGLFHHDASDKFSINVNDDSKITVLSLEALSGEWSGINAIWTGSVKDGMTVDSCYRWADNAFVEYGSELSLVYSDAQGYHVLSDVDFTFSHDDKTTSVIHSNRITAIFAPIDYTYISDEQASLRSLFGIIPILLIMITVVFAVRMIGGRE